MVMFILIACSLFGLLTVRFLQSMFVQSAQIHDYYKSYYLAKAWLELVFVQLPVRGLWFDFVVSSGSDIIKQNFLSAGNYYFESSIVGRSNLLSRSVRQSSTCSEPFSLNHWESLIFPLFYDKFDSKIYGTYDSLSKPIDYDIKQQLLSNFEFSWLNNNPKVSLWILISSWWDLYENWIYFIGVDSLDQGSFDNFVKWVNNSFVYSNLGDANFSNWPNYMTDWFKAYFIIANKDNKAFQFCLENKQSEFPLQQYWIKSIGVYNNQKLGLEVEYRQPLPSYFVDSMIGE